MQPLLKIQQVPISIEYKVQRAALEHKYTPPSATITRDRGGLNIQRTSSRVNIDTTEARASAGLKSTSRSISEFAATGRSAAQEATRTIVENGNAIADGSSSADIAASKAFPAPAETVMAFIPSVRPEITVDPGSISFDFQMDRLTFDWNINHKPQLEYVPGNIEFSVAQYPELIIEYLGSPIYVPPSANPDYDPPPNLDVEA